MTFVTSVNNIFLPGMFSFVVIVFNCLLLSPALANWTQSAGNPQRTRASSEALQAQPPLAIRGEVFLPTDDRFSLRPFVQTMLLTPDHAVFHGGNGDLVAIKRPTTLEEIGRAHV